MPFSPPSFTPLSPEQANPFGYGLEQAVRARLNAANAQAQEYKNPFVQRRELAEILAKEIENRYKPKDYETTFAHRGAQIRHMGEEDITSKYKREHGLLEPERVQLLKMAYGGSLPTAAVGEPTRIEQPQLNQAVTQALQQIQPSIPGMTPISNGPLAGNILQNMTQGQPQQTPMPLPSAQQHFIPGTDIPSTGRGGLADALVLEALGVPRVNPELKKYREGTLALAEKRERASAFRALPPDARSADIARAAPIVGDYTKAARLLMDGNTVEEIGKMYGYDDPSKLPPAAPPLQKPNITRVQRGNIARAAFTEIEPQLEKDLGMYPSEIQGYSPGAIKDAILGKNSKEIGRYLGAVFVNNESNALIGNAAGINVGIGLLKMMNQKSLVEGKFPGLLKNKEIVDSFRQTVKDYSNKIINAENVAMNRIATLQNPNIAGGESNPSSTSDIDAKIAELDQQIAALGG